MVDLPSGPRPSQRGHPRARQSFLVLGGILALAVASGSAFSIATIKHVEKGVIKLSTGPACTGSDCLHDVTPECASKICDFLILGSDTRAGLSRAEQVAFGTPVGQRSDTIILVRIDPVHDRTLVLSIPRDLRVNIPGYGVNKINTAFDHGPNTIVRP